MNKSTKLIEECAEAAHNVNRQYCLAIGDASQPSWEDAPDWQKDSIRSGVVEVLNRKTLRECHEAWLHIKERDGWVWGPVKDVDAKVHPCMLPYDQLPPEQQFRDTLFALAVKARVYDAGEGLS
jgi:hypothetical protein